MMAPMNSTGSNLTLLDYSYDADPIEEDLYESTGAQGYQISFVEIAFQILLMLISVITIASVIYLIVIMAKFKKLRNRINNLLLFYGIFNMANTILPIFIGFCELAGVRGIKYYFYAMYNFEHLTAITSFYVMTFLAFDWFVLHYYPEIYHTYPRTFKYGIGIGLVTLAALQWIINTIILCLDVWAQSNFSMVFEFASFAVCSIILICIAIFKNIREPMSDTRLTDYAFSIPKIVFVLFFSNYVFRTIHYIPRATRGVHFQRFFFVVSCIMECVFSTTPIVVVYLLGRYNKGFRVAYLKCCKKNVQQYNDDDLDSGSINESPENLLVTFDRDSVEIKL